MKNIGIIIADDNEFVPFLAFGEKNGGHKFLRHQRPGIEFIYKGCKIIIFYCGIGKVNAACAAAHMISENDFSLVLNAGLSGCVGELCRGDIVAGESYIEADFDITAAGKKHGEKTNQDYIYFADSSILEIALGFENVKKGKLGSGDLFLSDGNLKEFYRGELGIDAFDMESAAIASVCHFSNIKFLSLRKLADGADSGSIMEYREMDEKQEADLCVLLFRIIDKYINL